MPVVVQARRQGFVALTHVIGEKALHAFVFCERHVRANVEEESVRLREACRMPTEVRVLVINNAIDVFTLERVRRPQTGHAGTQYCDRVHLAIPYSECARRSLLEGLASTKRRARRCLSVSVSASNVCHCRYSIAGRVDNCQSIP